MISVDHDGQMMMKDCCLTDSKEKEGCPGRRRTARECVKGASTQLDEEKEVVTSEIRQLRAGSNLMIA